MMSFYLSLVTGEDNKLNFGIKNWHLIEIAALYILLVFAPPSIFEIAAQNKLLKSRLTQYPLRGNNRMKRSII